MGYPVPANAQQAVLVFDSLRKLNRHKNLRLGLPVTVQGRDTPWGYVREGSKLEPVDEMFKLLVEVKHHLDRVTYREAAEYLTSRTGVSITHQGIQKLFETRMPYDEAALPREERELL